MSFEIRRGELVQTLWDSIAAEQLGPELRLTEWIKTSDLERER